MKSILLCLLAVAPMACSFSIFGQAPSAQASSTTTPASPPLPTARPTGEPGSKDNPLLLALAPSPSSSEAVIASSEVLVGRLRSLTGYSIIAVQPPSELTLQDALANDSAHIAVLSPFGYLLARRAQVATAGLASQRDGRALYGAQFIANRTGRLESFFDSASDQNTASADMALLQLRDKKPCWSDLSSPSGHVIPLGFLKDAEAAPRPGAFLAGQPPVVRAVYAEGICDFGATFIDARSSPTLETDYPDVLERVIVLWRIPPIIPYEIVVFSTQVPLDVRRVLVRAFMDLMIEPEGKAAVQTLFGMDALIPADDGMFDQFDHYAGASGIDLRWLLGQIQG